ncbi:DEAD/DEAH box helicase [Kineococcus sp. SYSU DK002]|uniref:DEAD/DEAH box helicase n=1 Tax=Kineococcus sp. SYSU DK002 TaxID=3383123 RepID=UPI003D7CF1D7
MLAQVRRAPLSTAREIARSLAGTAWAADKSTVNSVLYRGLGSTFVKDESTRPRWSAAGGEQGSAPKTASTPPKPPRHRTDARGTNPAPQPTAAPAVSAMEELIASLRERCSTDDLPAPAPRVTRTRAVEAPATWGLSLHPWQDEAMRAWYGQGCRGVVEAVTGSGKTHLGLAAAARATADGMATTVLVPSVELQRQWVRRFASHLPCLTVATVGGEVTGDSSRADVVVAVVNSAARRPLLRGAAGDLIIADEVHRYGAGTWSTALREAYTRRLGLTATLERSDDAVDTVIRPYFGASAYEYTFERAIRDEVVSPFRLVLAPVGMTDEELAEYDVLSAKIGDCLRRLRSQGALAGTSGASLSQSLRRIAGTGGVLGRTAQAAETAMRARRHLLAELEGKVDALGELSPLVDVSEGTVVFTQSKSSAEAVADRLREEGVPAAALHADMDARERHENLEALERQRLLALAAPKLLDEGIDVPTVDLGIVTTASRSRRQMVQRLGRVIRRKPGGRVVTFVILFAEGTVEDPTDGAHEGFFDMVMDVAADVRLLDDDWTAEDFLGA